MAKRLHTDANNISTVKATIAAAAAGVPLEIVPVDLDARDNRKPAFLALSPLGLVPLLEESGLFYPNAIAKQLLSGTKALMPKSTFDQSRVEQYLEWDDRFTVASRHWIAALAGAEVPGEYAPQSEARTRPMLAELNAALNSRNFLVGDSLTLADVAIACSVYPLFNPSDTLLGSDAERAQYGEIVRWVGTLSTSKPFADGFALAGVNAALIAQSLAARYAIFYRPDEKTRYRLSAVPSHVFITTPIYYCNDEPHVGHVYSTLLADVVSRWYRFRGSNVFFQSGTDEHGQKVAQAAEKKGMTPKALCDALVVKFQERFKQMNFNMNRMIRTTDDDHARVCTQIWNKMLERGHIYKGFHEGWYCVSDEAFCTELQVVDGHDKEGKPCKVSTESGHPVVWVREENYKFRLSAFQDRLLRWIDENPECIIPAFRRREIRQFVAGGLLDLSVSRRNIKWGIPVPNDTDHVMYVWIDALANYLTGAGYDAQNNPLALPWWPATHIVGKDIIKFHAIYWPAFLMAIDVSPPRQIVAHGWWTKNRQKISKSLGNTIDLDETLRTIGGNYAVDVFRYALCRDSNISLDCDFSDEALKSHVNASLADELGNLLCRATGANLNPAQAVPAPAPAEEWTADDRKLAAMLDDLAGWVDHYLIRFDTQRALQGIWEVLTECNGYITRNAPWRHLKEATSNAASQRRYGTLLYLMCETLRIVGSLLLPFMPTAAQRILDRLNVPAELRSPQHLKCGDLQPGTRFAGVEEILFPKMGQPEDFAGKKNPKKKKDAPAASTSPAPAAASPAPAQ